MTIFGWSLGNPFVIHSTKSHGDVSQIIWFVHQKLNSGVPKPHNCLRIGGFNPSEKD
jgi:hypothetical protein